MKLGFFYCKVWSKAFRAIWQWWLMISIVIAGSGSLHAQTKLTVADSLLLSAYEAYRLHDYQRTLTLTNTVLELPRSDADSIPQLRAQFYAAMARQASNTNTYDVKEITNYAHRFKLWQLKTEEARANQFLAKIFGHYGNVTEELRHSLLALRLFEETNNKSGIASSRSNISLLYYDQHDYPAAFENIRAAIAIDEEEGDPFQLHGALNNLAIIFEHTGPVDSAIYYHKKALAIAREAGLVKSEGLSLSNLGNNYAANQQYEIAETTLLEALAIRKLHGNSKDRAYTHNRLANLYIQQAKLSSAKYHADQSLANALEAGELKITRMAYEREMEIARRTGNYKAELDYLKKVVALKDSILNESNTKELTQRMLTYEFERKLLLDSMANARDIFERDLIYRQNLASARTRNTAYLLAGLLLLLLSTTIYWRYRQRGKALQQAKQVEESFQQLQIAHETLKQTQARLIQAEKMASLGELTAGIAHEIQNPLNFVNNFSEINDELTSELVDELNSGNTNEAREIAQSIRDNSQKITHHGKRAGTIVKGMLEHSHQSAGEKVPTDLNALAEECLRLSYNGYRAKDKSFEATWKLDLDPALPKVSVVPQDISRVLINLINNAFYAAPVPPEGGLKDPDYKHQPTVWVISKKEGDRVLISVKDNGPGIPHNLVDKIFQPFFTTKPTGQGTGLGLSLSYDIIKTLGGIISVDSKPFQGSIFTIQLPL